MINRKFIILPWEKVQAVLDKPGFQENSCIIENTYLINKYGSSSFFIDEEWYNNLI